MDSGHFGKFIERHKYYNHRPYAPPRIAIQSENTPVKKSSGFNDRLAKSGETVYGSE